MSNYNDLFMDEAEKTVTCPYNKAHSILRKNFAKHLEKCRRSNGNSDMKKCQFNSTHVFPAAEIADHERKCTDRIFVEKMLEGISFKRKLENEESNEDEESDSKKPKSSTECEDEWDDNDNRDDAPKVDGIEERKKHLEGSNKIVHVQHMTKSKRKAARLERHQRVLEQETGQLLSDEESN